MAISPYGYAQKSRHQTANVDAAIERSAEYLLNHIQPNGTFGLNTDKPGKTQPRTSAYPIYQHAEIVYTLSHYLAREPDIYTQIAIEQAGRYLRDLTIAEVVEEPQANAVWIRPSRRTSKDPLHSCTNTTAVSLLALLQIEHHHAEFTPLNELQKLGNFLLFMQQPSGVFYASYSPSLDDKFTPLCDAVEGEAVMALLRLYRFDPHPKWLSAAYRALKQWQHLSTHWQWEAIAQWPDMHDPVITRLPQNQPTQHDTSPSYASLMAEDLIQQVVDKRHYGTTYPNGHKALLKRLLAFEQTRGTTTGSFCPKTDTRTFFHCLHETERALRALLYLQTAL